jgi:5-methylcytosine-specific restriction endonuclease McrA
MKKKLTEKQIAVLKKMTEINRHRIYNNTYSESARLRMGLARKGKKFPHSEETKRKISNSHKGIRPNAETLKKMSLSRKGKGIGNTNGFKKGQSLNKGKVFSSSWRLNLSKSHLGKKPSLETRIKLSKTRGEKHHSWRGGITKKSFAIRNSFEYKLWRNACFQRDNFTCQKTNISGGDLEVHHINNFSDFDNLRFDISNGITLSKKSHREFHNKYGYRNNTKEQIIDFLNKK